jgi:hypothetical protein
MWIVIVKFKDSTRYLSGNRLAGSLEKATVFASKKQAQRAYQEFFRDNSRNLNTCVVAFERQEPKEASL